MDPPDDDCTFYDAEDAPDAMGNAQATDAETPLVIDPRAGGVSLPDTFGESSTDDTPGVAEGADKSPLRDAVSLPDAFGESSTDDVDDVGPRVNDGTVVDSDVKDVANVDSCEKVVIGEALACPPMTIPVADGRASDRDNAQEVQDGVVDATPKTVLLKEELQMNVLSNNELLNGESAKDEPSNGDPSNGDPSKDEPLKQEPSNDEPLKQEPSNDESLKQEPRNDEPLKQEPPNEEPLKQRPPNDESLRQEPPKDEPLKQELPKDKVLRDENLEDDEDDEGYLAGVLGKSSEKAEARLAARRQARAEAREIRMRELERQQKEIEESCTKNYDSFTETGGRTPRSTASIATRSTSLGGSNSYLSSRRSSEDSLEEGISLRDVRHELKEVEEKFRKAMIQNAQLDNEKASLTYQVELLKDRLEDLEEAHAQLQREHRDKGRELDQLKRATAKLKEDMEFYKTQLEERDRLIQEKGLMIVGDDQVSSDDDGSDEPDSNSPKKPRKRALVSIESAELLQSAGEGSLDVRLRRFAEERNELQDQVRHLKLELEEQYSRSKSDSRRVSGATMNGPDTEVEDVQREANKLLGEYKFKLQKAEQDVSTLQATVARLESQVIRYKSASESAEKVEDELKVEKRKLQRELRESQSRVEELEVSNSHLQRRLEKLKSAKSALLKEL